MNEKPRSYVVITVEIEEEETIDEPMSDAILEDDAVPKTVTHLPKKKESTRMEKTDPFPERLAIEKPIVHPEYDIVNELKNVCIKIPLLQAIKDIPIYSKVIKDLCIKRPGRKKKDPVSVNVIGELSDHISGTPKISKYDDPGNPIVTVVIDKVSIGNTLIDLGAAINMMTTTALAALKLERFLRPTPTVLELADHTTVKPAQEC